MNRILGIPDLHGGALAGVPQRPQESEALLGWHYLSNATCLVRPHLFCALFVATKIIMSCQMTPHF